VLLCALSLFHKLGWNVESSSLVRQSGSMLCWEVVGSYDGERVVELVTKAMEVGKPRSPSRQLREFGRQPPPGIRCRGPRVT
jgi:hypothetical protein